ncbi:MAG: SDR family NAD(P)-dependent oxidoreductase [Candidatus Methylomirabilales bacterium]
MFALTDRTAIVTGAGSRHGIGRATAVALARQGADVAVCDVKQEGVDETCDAVRQLGRRSLGFVASVTEADQVQRMVDAVAAAWGRVDILVNNAGITQPVKIGDTSPEDWDRIIDVNMKGVFLCSKAVVPVMARQRYGRIINLSSVSAKRGGGVFGGAHYSASKAGVLGFAKALAREVAADGITVNSVAPGLVITDIWGGVGNEAEQRRLAEAIPAGRLGRPEDVAALICFLASEEAGYITGEDVDINGGSHID